MAFDSARHLTGGQIHVSREHPERRRLSRAQREALRYVDEAVRERQADASMRLNDILRSSGCRRTLFDAAAESIRGHARVVLHFHPDRVGVKTITVAEALLQEGQYRSQFETGLSSGSRSAFPGGERDVWERRLFGGAYQTAGTANHERPKYGALELIRYPDGPWPRFGSCYFVLRAGISARTSLTFSGSEQALAPECLGTIGKLESVMALLLAEVAAGEGASVRWPPYRAPTLGIKDATVSGLLEILARDLPAPRLDPATGTAGRVLDTGIEAQAHGPVELADDVEMLVADPSFEGTQTGECLHALATKYGFPLQWHCGFRLHACDVPDDFRGPAVSRLAQRIAEDGIVDAAVIGTAERSLYSQPERWRDWGSHQDALQHLKQLWHVLVHFGAPARRR